MYSALPLGLPANLLWANAQEPGLTLPVISGPADFSAYPFQVRDGYLAYRDLVLGAYLSLLATAVGDVWGTPALFPTMSGTPAPDLMDALTDLPSLNYGSPGPVNHVDSSSVPINAAMVDQQLYARDLIIYAWLQLISLELPANALPMLANGPSTLNEAWSLGAGNYNLRSVSQGYVLNVDLFKKPDQNLAYRDNVLAAYVANLRATIDQIYGKANRMLLKGITPRGVVAEAESYQVVYDDPTQRIWSEWPILSGLAGKLIYSKLNNTLSWQDEIVGPTTSGIPAQPGFATGDGAVVQLVNQVPSAPDAEFYRQKSSRIVIAPFKDTTIFRTTSPENYISYGGLWQPDSALLSAPGIIQLSLPSQVPAGALRLGLLIKPSRIINIFGFQGSGGTVVGTAIGLPSTGGALTWNFKAPPGGILLSFQFQDPQAVTTAFFVTVLYNGSAIYTGAWAYGQSPGTSIVTPPVQLTTPASGASQVVVQWAGASGSQLQVEQLQITTVLPASTPINYQLSATLSSGGVNYATPNATQLAGVPERLDCVWLDLFAATPLTSPTVAINFQLGASQATFSGIALYVYAYDLRVYNGVTMIQSPAQYVAHKRSLLRQSADTAAATWVNLVNTSSVISATSPVGPTTIQTSDQFVAAGQNELDVPPPILSSYIFLASNPPTISLVPGTSLQSQYKLRAKFTSPTVNIQAANGFDNNGATLDTLPAPGTYTVGLYWLQYDSTGANLLIQGPQTTAQVIILASAVPEVPEIRSYDPVYGFIWDVNANTRWTNALLIGQPRLTQAFQTAGPGDLGRAALVPAGLQLASDGTVLAPNPTPQLTPVLRLCMPWMVEFGALVATPDLWPYNSSSNAAASTITGVTLINPNFTYTIVNPQSGLPSVSNLTSVSSDTGLALGDAFQAYNLLNTGVGGGYNNQSITVTAWFQNLAVGTTYTLNLTQQIQIVGGSTTTEIVSQSFVAPAAGDLSVPGLETIGSTTSWQLTPITAATGTIVSVLSATLS